ncbi:Drug/metabolite transporter [Macleaya cordata]|uniref:Drug/metabolite transporter n=1 Tax=Macleaya cordata TaxID=56857 RepID=A0A200RBC1_MACCD|nr:Drug/metabolite transporter [Macleaya cordata]
MLTASLLHQPTFPAISTVGSSSKRFSPLYPKLSSPFPISSSPRKLELTRASKKQLYQSQIQRSDTPIVIVSKKEVDGGGVDLGWLPAFPHVLIASMSNFLFGYHIGVMNGPIVSIAHELGFEGNSLLEGLVVSIFIAGAFIGSVSSGSLVDNFGCRRTLQFDTIPLILGAIISAQAHSLDEILLGRFLVGLGIGVNTVLVPIYISEVAPTRYRGSLGSLCQIGTCLGIVTSLFLGISSENDPHWWRTMLYLASVPGFILALGMQFSVDSPRWLCKVGRLDDAKKVISNLWGEAEVEKSIDEFQSVIKNDGSDLESSWLELLEEPHNRVALIGGALFVLQQFAGINGVLYFSSLTFKDVGITSSTLASLFVGLTNFAGALLALNLIDKQGRQRLLIGSYLGMAASMFLIVYSISSPLDEQLSHSLSILGSLMYIFTFAIGAGPVTGLVIPELSSSRTRGKIMAFSFSVHWVCNFIVGLFFLELVDRFGIAPVYASFGGVSLLSAIFAKYFIVETKGRSLEEIEMSLNPNIRSKDQGDVFALPKGHLCYQVIVSLYWKRSAQFGIRVLGRGWGKMASSVEMSNGGGDHVVELISNSSDAEISSLSEEIAPLLSDGDKSKINIFTVSYPRKKPTREKLTKVGEAEVQLFTQFVSWTWGGSKYSGLLCMALSSFIYCVMDVLSDVFTVQSIPLFESVFTRSTIILISSFVWLRKTGQPIFGPTNIRHLLVSRALMGFMSLFSFVYSVQSLPLSQAIVLNFTTPIMASIAARIILQEKLKLADIGGLACSFFGLLFIFRPVLTTQGGIAETTELGNQYTVRVNHPIFAVLVGLFSSITGGISYCLIRAGAKASDQPVVTVLSFSLLACPAAAISTFALQNFVLPNFYSLFLMVVLSILAFFAEVLLARGLQLEKTSKVANMHYIEPLLLQMVGIGLSRLTPSFGRLAGCLLILVSVCYTVCFGPEKEME